MNARLKHLCAEPVDLAIVGGGIHGAALAWVAAAQGLRTALVEQRDFAHATSANSLKILHGGLRYLQHADVMRMWESLRARALGLRLQPHLARPAAFLVPTHPWAIQSRPCLWAALCFNDLMSWPQNRGLPPSQRLPRGRLLSRPEAEALLRGAAGRRITGAAVWHDGFIENTERFILAFVLSAEELGARIANYVRADQLLVQNGVVRGVRVRDEETGDEGELQARCVVDAGGPWAGTLLPANLPRPLWAWTRGFSVIVRRRWFGHYGVGLEGRIAPPDPDALFRREKQNLFFAPWRAGTIIGVIYRLFDGPPETCALRPEEIEDFLRQINEVFPPAELTLNDVTFAHVGVLPAPADRARRGNPDPCKHTQIVDFSRTAGLEGYWAIRGVKLTTGLTVAERVVTRLAPRLGVRLRARLPETLYGGERLVDARELASAARAAGLELTAEQQAHLATEYGARFEQVLRLAGERAEAREPLAPGQPVLGAEVLHAVRREHARKLADVVFRRTNLGTFAYPGREALRRAADLMAAELGWDPVRRDREVAEVEAHYRRLGLAHVL